MKTIIELLGVIAWSATVIIAIILLKIEIHALLARLTKVKMLEAYYTARRLRNEASHFPEFSISTDEAEKYIAFCLDLAARITAADTILKGKSQQGGGGYGSPAAGSPSPDR